MIVEEVGSVDVREYLLYEGIDMAEMNRFYLNLESGGRKG